MIKSQEVAVTFDLVSSEVSMPDEAILGNKKAQFGRAIRCEQAAKDIVLSMITFYSHAIYQVLMLWLLCSMSERLCLMTLGSML